MFPDQYISRRNGPIGPFREAKRACLGDLSEDATGAYKTYPEPMGSGIRDPVF